MKTHETELAMIVAADLNNGIGKNNQMPWHISDDLKRFKALTTGHTIVMGRKTWESLPKKPLPNRKNIVLTHNKNYQAEGAEIYTNPNQVKNSLNGTRAFIIGGAEIYKQFYPEIDTLYMTRILKNFNCDTHLHFLDMNDWKETKKSDVLNDEKTGTQYQFIDLNRKN